MKITESVTLNLSLPRPSDTTPVWVVSDKSVCSLVVTDGGMSAIVTALANGTAQVDVRSNCDFGSGVREHHTKFDIVVDEDSVPATVEEPEIEVPVAPVKRYWTIQE